MKTVSSALRSLIESGAFISRTPDSLDAVPFDMYTITLSGGTQLLYTSADFPILAPSQEIFPVKSLSGVSMWTKDMIWQPLPIDSDSSRSTGHWKVGLDSDTWSISVTPRTTLSGYPSMIGDVPWLRAVASGVLDGADCVVSRAYFAEMPSWDPQSASYIGRGAVPTGTLVIFRGYLGDVQIGSLSADLTVNDYRQLLQQQMPRNIYMAECRHQFCDSGCSLNLQNFTVQSTAISGDHSSVLLSSALQPPVSGTSFVLGRIVIIEGKNSGLSRMISSWDGDRRVGLLSPLPYTVSSGDRMSVSLGCRHSMSDCRLFGNLENYSGEPFIPPPEVSIT